MLTIYAVSDSIGETAEQVAQAAASQFDDEIEVKRVPYIKTLEDVEELIGEIREINNVSPTTAAPYFFTKGSILSNISSSPLTEFKIGFPL